MLFIILALLTFGLILLIVELVFIPGTTIVGMIGFVFTIAGIIVSYKHFGSETGFYILLGTAGLTLVALIISFRSNMWSRFSLKSSIDSKVNDGLLQNLQIGDNGLSVSALRPSGKAQIKDQQYEVRTTGAYVNNGVPVRVISISLNQIVVEPLQ